MTSQASVDPNSPSGSASGFDAHYLWIELRVIGDNSAALHAIKNSAASVIVPEERMTIRVFGDADRPGISIQTRSASSSEASEHKAEPADSLPFDREVTGKPLEVVEAAYGAVHDRVLHWARRHGWIRIHAALVEVNGSLVAIAGPSGAGKTTLVTELALAGHDLHGDEAVFVRDGEVLALPRPLHLKTGGLGVPPALASVAGTVLDYVDPLVVIDPAAIVGLLQARPAALASDAPNAAAASDSAILTDGSNLAAAVRSPRRLDQLIILGARVRGQWLATPASTAEMLAVMIDDVAPFAVDHALALRELVRASATARITVLSAGDPSRGVDAVERLISSAGSS